MNTHTKSANIAKRNISSEAEEMRALLLKKLTEKDCERLLQSKRLTTFDLAFRDYLLERRTLPDIRVEDIIRIRRHYDLTQADIAQILGVSSMRVIRWESGASQIPRMALIFYAFLECFGADFFKIMDINGDHDKALPIPLPAPVKSQRTPVFKKSYTAGEVKAIRLQLGLSRKDLADALHVTRDAVDKWEQGTNRVQGLAALVFYNLERFGKSFLS